VRPAVRFCFTALLLTGFGRLDAAQFTATPGQPLQPLLAQAAAGDELRLPAGRYSAPLRIDVPLRLVGEPGAVIDAGGHGHAIEVSASDVEIRGLTIANWGRDLNALDSGIFVHRNAENVRIVDNHLRGAGFGIWLDRARGARIVGNRIEGDPSIRSQDRGNGIQLYNASHTLVEDNHIWQVRDAIYIDVSDHNVLRGNRMHDLRFGIHYMYSMDNRVEHNRTWATRTGYALMQSKRLTVIGNQSENDQNYGFLMNNITHSVVRGNRVSHVRSGGNLESDAHIAGAEGKAVFIYNSQFNEFSGNLFAHSAIGIHLTAGSEDNKVFGNAFVANHTQVKYVATREQEWSYQGRGNYWSDYLGWDLDGDGIGDTVYQPNDAVDRLLWRHPEAKILMHSPAVQTLRWAQQQFPVFRPPGVKDSAPLMTAPAIGEDAP
jgi:Nitrous oxidase accessory protein